MIGDTAGHSNRTYRIIQTWPFSFSPPTHASNHPHAPGRHLPTSTYTYETQAWSACLEMTYVKETPSFTPHPSAGSEASPHFLAPLWPLGIVSLESLSETRYGHAYMLLPSSCLDTFRSARKMRDIRHAKLSLDPAPVRHLLPACNETYLPPPPLRKLKSTPWRPTGSSSLLSMPSSSFLSRHTLCRRCTHSRHKFQYYNYSAVKSSLHSRGRGLGRRDLGYGSQGSAPQAKKFLCSTISITYLAHFRFTA